MDSKAFDRLAVAVGSSRERTSRRGLLGLLIGGVAAGSALDPSEVGAKRRRRNNKHYNNDRYCFDGGGPCTEDNQCCSRNCKNFTCRGGGNGGGGNNGNGNNGLKKCKGRYGTQYCPVGFKCCNNNGFAQCTLSQYPNCCGSYSFGSGYSCCNGGSGYGNYGGCPAGATCCGGNGNGGCCAAGTRCCGNKCCSYGSTCCGNKCCPAGSYCYGNGCRSYSNYRGREVEVTPEPTVDRLPVDESAFMKLTTDATQP